MISIHIVLKLMIRKLKLIWRLYYEKQQMLMVIKLIISVMKNLINIIMKLVNLMLNITISVIDYKFF